jgi:hypothetical protein
VTELDIPSLTITPSGSTPTLGGGKPFWAKPVAPTNENAINKDMRGSFMIGILDNKAPISGKIG